MMIYRTTTLEDVAAIVDIYNEERLTWPAYYPSLLIEIPTKIINLSHEQPTEYFTLAVEKCGKLVGYVSMHTHHTFGVKVAENIGIFTSNKLLSPMESVLALRNLVRRTHYWAMNVGCKKVIWMVTTGKWNSFQAIVAKEGCFQVGINMEFNYGTWRR